jgi:DNA polymerase-1
MISFDKEKVIEKYGVPPALFVDYKAFRGDSSDNIPGVKGIGKKRASQLIKQYGTVEQIFANFDDLKDIFKRRLKGKKGQVLKTKKLVTLRCDIDLDVTLSDAELNYNYDEVLDFFKSFNFKSLINKYNKKREDQMKFNFK